SGCGFGCGVVFKVAPDGTDTVLHAFTGSDGAQPLAGLIADSSGDLYGTTQFGGASGNGVVFKLSPDGSYTVLYSFAGASDWAQPLAGLIADSSGNLHGTTRVGGGSGRGTVFKLAPDWTETVLYSFTGAFSDGANPRASLISDSSGNLYGTTQIGGAANGGVVFQLSPDGTETVLYSSCRLPGCGDGCNPLGGLITASRGNPFG